MTADFTGETLPLPPGVEDQPTFDTDIARPAWLSPVASHRLGWLGEVGNHLVVGGRTIWVRSGPGPSALVASHPNRLGSAEDLDAMVVLAEQLGVTAHVEVDPLLLATARLPAGIQSIVRWQSSGSPIVKTAAARAQQGAEALRRRLAQIRGLMFPVERRLGRTVTVVLPIPADRVIDGLAALGTTLDRAGWWEGGISMTVGWWHTRRQIDDLAAAIGSIVSDTDPVPVPPDRLDRIPDDLPLRRLNTIPLR